MTTTTAAKTVPLTKLVPSAANMRRLNSEAGLDALAASIRAHGLIQNLTVRPAKGGKFEVVAGARRLGRCARSPRPATSPRISPFPCAFSTARATPRCRSQKHDPGGHAPGR